MGGRARRLRLGRRQRERRGEEEQGAGADGTRRAADQRHRTELLPLLCPVFVAGSATAVSRGARDAVQQAATRDGTGLEETRVRRKFILCPDYHSVLLGLNM